MFASSRLTFYTCDSCCPAISPSWTVDVCISAALLNRHLSANAMCPTEQHLTSICGSRPVPSLLHRRKNIQRKIPRSHLCFEKLQELWKMAQRKANRSFCCKQRSTIFYRIYQYILSHFPLFFTILKLPVKCSRWPFPCKVYFQFVCSVTFSQSLFSLLSLFYFQCAGSGRLRSL